MVGHNTLPDTTSVTVGLFLPGLLTAPPGWLPAAPAAMPQVDALARLLSRATPSHETPGDHLHSLADLFGLNVPRDLDVPLAAMHFVSGAQTDWGMLVCPVCLQPDRSGLVLVAAEDLVVSAEEAADVIASINQHFQTEPWHLVMCDAQTWWVQSQRNYHVQTTSLNDALSRDVASLLATGPDSRYWRAMQNEMQMLLHDHPVNLAREAQGRLPINGIWLWGSGVAPSRCAVRWRHIVGKDMVTQALSVFCNSALHGHNHFAHVLTLGESVLVVDTRCHQALEQRDAERWQAEVERINVDYIKPLLQWLRQDKRHQLLLLDDTGRRFRLSHTDLRKWWRRLRPYSYWCSGGGA